MKERDCNNYVRSEGNERVGESISSRLFRAALANTCAIVIAFEEAGVGITLADTGRPAGVVGVLGAGPRRGCLDLVLVLLGIAIGSKFRLNGGGVNAVGMQAAANLARKAHIPLRALALDFRVNLDVD